MNNIKILNIKTIAENMKKKVQSFELNPLDISIAQMQMNLQKRLPLEVPEHGDFAPVVEKFVSKDPTMNISSVKIVCKKSDKEAPKQKLRTLEISIESKTGADVYKCVIADGDKKSITDIVKEKDFFTLCKTIALDVDNLIK